MPRLTITVTDEQATLLEEKTGDGGEYESKSEAVRTFIQEYERLSERVADLESEYEKRIADLERENERLRNEKQLILEQREEHTDLVRAIEREQSREDRRAQAGVLTRAKWWLVGMADEE